MKTIEQRFWPKVAKTPTCWWWHGSKNNHGYGRICINYKRVMAHRFIYELVFGLIPEGMVVCHRCDNPSCVNPDHLFLGTMKDNMQDASKKGRLKGNTFARKPCRDFDCRNFISEIAIKD